jgi:hypothetical protein
MKTRISTAILLLPFFACAQSEDSRVRRPLNIATTPAHPPASGVVVHRTMMPESGPSSFAVGFASGIGLSYDAGRGGVNYIWWGDFVDLEPTWRAKINEPAAIRGQIAYREAVRFPLRLNGSEREPTFEFRGYSLQHDAVEFRYVVDGVLVREELRALADGSGVTRHFRLSEPVRQWSYAVEPQPNLTVRSHEGAWNEPRTFLSGTGREFSIVITRGGAK